MQFAAQSFHPNQKYVKHICLRKKEIVQSDKATEQ